MFGCDRAFKSLISRIAVMGNFVHALVLVAGNVKGDSTTYTLFLMMHEYLLERHGGVILLRSCFVDLTTE